MSKLDYPDECRLENFLEWCLEKIQFCDLCDEIERLGYGIDHNIHVTKGSAIIELFRQRNNRTDDSNYLTDIESIVPVGVPVTDLPPTALSMATCLAQTRGCRASLLRRRPRSTQMNESTCADNKLKEVIAAVRASLPPAVMVPLLPSSPHKMTHPQESDILIQPDCEVVIIDSIDPEKTNAAIVPARRVHFCFASTSPPFHEEYFQSSDDDEYTESSENDECLESSENDENFESSEKNEAGNTIIDEIPLVDEIPVVMSEEDERMMDEVYKQIEMWGEALCKDEPEREDLIHIIDDKITMSTKREPRPSFLRQKTKIKEIQINRAESSRSIAVEKPVAQVSAKYVPKLNKTQEKKAMSSTWCGFTRSAVQQTKDFGIVSMNSPFRRASRIQSPSLRNSTRQWNTSE